MGNARYPEKPVSKEIYHRVDGIPVRERFPKRREGLGAIKYSTQVGEWGEYKRRDDGYSIEVFRIESIHESSKREKECRQEYTRKDYSYVSVGKRYKKCSRHQYESSNHQSSDDSSRSKSQCHDPSRGWRHQYFLDILLEFCCVYYRGGIREGIGNYPHHDESGSNKCRIGNPRYLSDATPEKSAKYRKIETRGNNGWEDGLWPYSKYPNRLTTCHGEERDIDLIRGHRRGLLAFFR